MNEQTQSGWTQTYGDTGYTVIAMSGTDATGKNFGNFKNITISGMKFNDLNGNGIQDETEPGLPGWTILLTKNSQSDGNTVTDSTGH